ncbi:MAG: hypothetical protein QM831_28885 [Kofleriaceae bacterium]
MTATTAASLVVACGGDDGGSNTKTDSKVFMDAPGSGSGSGSNQTSNALGSDCNPQTANSCPTGFQCVQFQNESTGHCNEICTAGAGDMCATGYTGPGKPECIVTATAMGSGSGSGSSVMVCGIICGDATGGQICGSGSTCNGTCPGTMTCSQPLKNGSGTQVGSACF